MNKHEARELKRGDKVICTSNVGCLHPELKVGGLYTVMGWDDLWGLLELVEVSMGRYAIHPGFACRRFERFLVEVPTVEEML